MRACRQQARIWPACRGLSATAVPVLAQPHRWRRVSERDLAQETMVKAYINIRSFKGLSSFGTWLYRIAYNEFYNEKRRRHEESMPTMDTSGSDSPRPMEHPDINSAHMTETQLTVHAALQCLNDNERTAVTLFYIEDLPIKKIAVIMQCSEGNIKSMLHRGKAKMGKYINFEQNYNLI